MRIALFAVALLACAGCTNSATVEPGHVGLLFQPRNGGLKPQLLKPGRVVIGRYDSVVDFDATFTTRKETVRTTSQEGLAMDLTVEVIFRPIVSELFQLASEISGTSNNYYEEVVAPEFRSAARGVFARHSYMELQSKNEKIEDEIEADLRRRIHGRHVEISSVTLESIQYAPEIAAAVRAKLVGEQEAARQKAQLENEALKTKLALEHDAEVARMKAEQMMRDKENERKVAEQDAAIEKVRAETESATRITRAKAEAEERQLLAKAKAAENKAEANNLTSLQVMMHAYDALGNLGGQGTTIFLGDFAHAPAFLFPHGGFGAYGAVAPAVGGGPKTP